MGLPWRSCSGQGPHPVKTLEPRRFSRVASGFSKTTGISGFSRASSAKTRGFHTQLDEGPAKSLQSCPTLCDHIDGSPPGSPVPGILQASCSGQGPHPVKTLEPRRFSRVASGFSKTTGISGFLLGWPWEAQSSPRAARERESWGWRSSPGPGARGCHGF